MQAIFKYIKGDRVIWAVVLLLAIFSVLVVYSSIVTLAYKYQGGNTEYYLFKHSIIILIGLALMYFAHKVNYRYYSRISQIGLFLAIPLLLFTLLTGTTINDASRWLMIPIINQTFQTSDLAKLALIMFLARMLSKRQDHIKDFNQAFVPIMIPVLIVCGLIMPANLSTAAMLFVTCLVLMFIGRINLAYIISLIAIGVVCLGVFIAIGLSIDDSQTSEENSAITNRVITWKNRIINFSEGTSQGNYQAEQSKIAIATGGVIGKGPGRSTQRNFLPQSYSDFIFATVIEEYGILGGTFTLLLYLILLYRGILIARNAPRTFGSLLAIGLSFSLVFQAMINMAVAVNLFPVTGQPLPMVSMGGTSIWFTCLAVGIILSVSRNADKEKMEVAHG